MNKVLIEDRDRIEIEDDCIDDVDRALNPIGRFYRYNAMHAGTIVWPSWKVTPAIRMPNV